MPECELIKDCEFYNNRMENMPAYSYMLKEGYCRIDNTFCAIYRVYKAFGRENISSNLFPDQLVIAKRIIAKGALLNKFRYFSSDSFIFCSDIFLFVIS